MVRWNNVNELDFVKQLLEDVGYVVYREREKANISARKMRTLEGGSHVEGIEKAMTNTNIGTLQKLARSFNKKICIYFIGCELGDQCANDQKQFSGIIKRMRVLKGMTQNELAEACGAEVAYIRRLERGEIGTTLYGLAMLANSLGCKARIEME